jgi:hypothetical protein
MPAGLRLVDIVEDIRIQVRALVMSRPPGSSRKQMDCEISCHEDVWFVLSVDANDYVCKLKSIKYAFGWNIDARVGTKRPREDLVQVEV